MNQLTEEQRERVDRIRKRVGTVYVGIVQEDMDLLLSLLDSQAAEDRPRPLPKWFVCIDPDESPLVVALLRGSGEAKENEAAKMHLALCAHCKDLWMSLLPPCVMLV